MDNGDLRKRTRYFVITAQNAVHEFYTPEKAFAYTDKKIVVMDRFKTFQTHLQGYDWRISTFHFINKEQNEYKLTYNSWTVEAIDIIRKTGGGISFSITLADPFGIIKKIPGRTRYSRSVDDLNAHDIEIVVFTWNNLLEHSAFLNWMQAELEKENQRLKEKIAQLQEKLKEHSASEK